MSDDKMDNRPIKAIWVKDDEYNGYAWLCPQCKERLDSADEICPNCGNTVGWNEYMRFQMERPELFKYSPELNIITDVDEMSDFENKNARKLGVCYSSKYNALLVDLVEDRNGNRFPYERIVPASSGEAVVCVPICDEKFILLEQFRHAIRKSQIAFPRGFGGAGSGEETAAKEIHEELGAEAKALNKIGVVAPDSGLTSSEVGIWCCAIDAYKLKMGYEGIRRIVAYTEDELEQAIRCGEITDGFTLSAFALYKAREHLSKTIKNGVAISKRNTDTDQKMK